MQMTAMMSIIQDENSKLNNASKLFYEMVEMYRTDYKSFSSVLKEANFQVSGFINYKR